MPESDAKFALHPQLEKDTFAIGDLPLCRALLMNNALFPWLILVPRVSEAREILDLEAPRRHQLMDEIAQTSEVMQKLFRPDKLNVAALGNQVPQLHVHLIARFTADTAWPAPVWGGGHAPYPDPQPLIGQLWQRLRPGAQASGRAV